MIRILVVDDHMSVAEGTKLLLEQEEDFSVTVINSGEEALTSMLKQTFDIYLFDLKMPGISGEKLAKKALEIDSEAKVIIYTGIDIEPYMNILIESGVSSFVSKTASTEQLITTIRSVLYGNSVIPIEIFQQLRRGDGSLCSYPLGKYKINKKEKQILEQVSLGKTNKEIAEIIYLSTRTVEYHLTNIFKKLEVESRTAAVEKAKRIGLIR